MILDNEHWKAFGDNQDSGIVVQITPRITDSAQSSANLSRFERDKLRYDVEWALETIYSDRNI